MKKFLSVVVASSFLTVAVPALAEQEVFAIGDQVYTATVDAQGRQCPRGYKLVPRRRFDFKRFRWVTTGSFCHKPSGSEATQPGGDHDSRH